MLHPVRRARHLWVWGTDLGTYFLVTGLWGTQTFLVAYGPCSLAAAVN